MTTKPGPKPNPESKRNSDGWVAVTAFLTPPTRSRLQNAIHKLKQAGIGTPDDQSEVLGLVPRWPERGSALVDGFLRGTVSPGWNQDRAIGLRALSCC